MDEEVAFTGASFSNRVALIHVPKVCSVSVVFSHDANDPIFSIGSGRTNFSELHGNFEIKDEVLQKLPLDAFSLVSQDGASVHVTLTTAEDPNLKVDFYLAEISQNSIDISTVTTNAGAYNRLWVRLWAEAEEQVWGVGEQFSYLNLRGRHYPVWTSEQGVGRDGGVIANASDVDGGAGGEYYTTYFPQASYLSSRRYSLFIDDPRYLVFNFSDASRHEVFLHNHVFHATLLREATLMATVQAVTTALGTQPQLPDWILRGAILGVQQGTEEMLFHYEEAKVAGVDVSGLWIQDWSGSIETMLGHRVYWNWRWNQTYYPDLDLAIETLAQEGVRVLTYINPHLIEGSDMFEEAAAQGFLMTDSEGNAFRQDFGGFLAGTVDLLNPDGFNWYKAEIEKNMIAMGFGGWMADFGEYTRLDMFSAQTNHDAETRHNLLPVAWAHCNRAALEDSGQLGVMVPFMRSGGLGSSGYQVLSWAGDQNVNWAFGDGLPTTIIAALSLAMSGMGVTHFDIGGYTTQAPVLARTKELFLRSAEYAVFTPVMRTHEGNKPESNHQFYSDLDTLLQFARLSKMHTRLLPYTRSLLQDLEATGTPVQRPLFLDFENDPLAFDVEYQYMFGPDLVVAPILYKGVEQGEAYLPGAGVEWVHLWGDGTPVAGGTQQVVSSPIGYPPVFYRKGSPYEALFQEIAVEFGRAGGLAELH
ncbi:sulfoquinovosidase-like isoform X2 [Eriocheir sinensis]|uniref:sulfoquinovosidase-like isoform X2 n=1 Tax=Eriocheir sinensis TaxID=95602 RepID=UPI0021C9E5D1|nr:sulfoquinovosidase-like isoform X2 [Eriocheir sinensis]